MLPRFPSTANSSPIKSRPEFGRQRGRRAYPVRADESPHFRAGFGVEAIHVPVIAAEINLAVMNRRARPEILVPPGIDLEIPHHRSVASIEAPENAAVAAEVNALAVGGGKGFRNAVEEIRIGRGEAPPVVEHRHGPRLRLFDRKAEFGEAEGRDEQVCRASPAKACLPGCRNRSARRRKQWFCFPVPGQRAPFPDCFPNSRHRRQSRWARRSAFPRSNCPCRRSCAPCGSMKPFTGVPRDSDFMRMAERRGIAAASIPPT